MAAPGSKGTAPFRAAVLTVSDSCARGERRDLSGPVAAEALTGMGFVCQPVEVVPDGEEPLAGRLAMWCDQGTVDLVVTTGGTGLSPSDLTPEATRRVIQREVPGIGELLRRASDKPTAALSRATAGLRGGVLIVNLPGSTAGVREGLALLAPLLPHALAVAAGRVDRCGG